MKRRTEILVEIEREITISSSGSNRSWCVSCGKQVQMLTVDEAAQMMKADQATVFQLTESGELHFATTNHGMLLICPNSLMISRKDEQQNPKQALLIADGKVSVE